MSFTHSTTEEAASPPKCLVSVSYVLRISVKANIIDLAREVIEDAARATADIQDLRARKRIDIIPDELSTQLAGSQKVLASIVESCKREQTIETECHLVDVLSCFRMCKHILLIVAVFSPPQSLLAVSDIELGQLYERYVSTIMLDGEQSQLLELVV